jgi:hypothetical protein
MQSRTFGRRVAPQPTTAAPATPAATAVPNLAALLQPDDEVDRELETWKAARKAHKRSFREPWRSVSVAAAIGFGLSSWLLPDSVSNIAQMVTFGLAAASVAAGFRRSPPASGGTQKSEPRF